MNPARLPWIDAARGGALLAMFAYHLVWDMGFYRLIDPALPGTGGFKLFGHAIATAFLALAGMSLVLARQRADFLAGFWRRLVLLAGAAGAVTLASLWFSPDAPIYFGILHCIALSSLLALPLLRADPRVLGLAMVWPGLLAYFVQSAALDGPALSWFGLGTNYPQSEDFRPLFPWLAALMAGVLAARLWVAGSPQAADRAAFRPKPGPLAWMGRHSLAIYLIHQPVLVGLVALAAGQLQPAAPPGPAPGFQAECLNVCAANGAKPEVCRKGCGCIEETLKREGLWSAVATGQMNSGQPQRLTAIALQCSQDGQ